MEVRPGYKLTEVGVIPEDWNVKPLGELASVSAGGTPNRSNANYWNGEIPWVTTSEVDFHTINSAGQFITKEGLNNSAAKLLPPGTLLMALYGQGKTRGKTGILGIEAATNQACAAIALNRNASTEFIFYFLASQYETIRKLSNTGNQENLNGSLVRSISILLPPTNAEQRAIAATLSDVDALLGGLARLIAKKRHLKQAAMQQLLTGQTRLPGFYGQWESANLASVIGTLETGVSVNSVEDSDEGSFDGMFILKTSAVAAGRFMPRECKRIALRDLSRACLNPLKDTIIISRMNTPDLVGECAYVDRDYPNLFVPDRLWMTRFKQNLDISGRWLAYLLSSPALKRQIGAAATGTSASMKNLSKQAFMEIPIELPSGPEQTAIAALLSDMDAELSALEARRDKTRALKQGMMQELLTGRTRLV